MANPKPTPDIGFRGATITSGTPKAPPPPPPPPPPAAKKGKSANAVFIAYLKAHPAVRPYSQLIAKWAAVYKVDPTYLAALINFESGGDPNAQSTADALGLGQIHIPTWGGKQTPWGETITREWATVPTNGIRFAAWYLSRNVDKYGTYDAAYRKGYNPGYTGAGPFAAVPKTYVATGTGLSPKDSASVSVETAGEKAVLTDPWAVLTAKGQIRFVKGAEPPKNALRYGSTPLTQSQFNTVWRQTYEDTFFAYTGRRATGKEVAGILKNAPSIYTLSNSLAGNDSFTKSPVYKAHAPGLIAIARQTLGENWKPSGGIIRKAIAQNWDQATFEAHLKSLPAYESGPAFKDQLAKKGNVFQSVYGHKPDGETLKLIHDVTKAGWTEDQFASWLRNQPSYQQSPEYQSKALAFGQAMGLITGSMGPTLSQKQVDDALASRPNNPFGAQATGPGADPNRPDNKPGPRGAGVAGLPVRPNDRAVLGIGR